MDEFGSSLLAANSAGRTFYTVQYSEVDWMVLVVGGMMLDGLVVVSLGLVDHW